MRYEKIWYQLAIAESPFFIVIHLFSLVKAAMNAPRVYNPWHGFFLLPEHLGGFIERCS